MLLPPPIFELVSRHFDHHNAWHVGRRLNQEELRFQFHGECADALAGINECGSGCDFLKFHRRMMKHFFFVLQTVDYDGFAFEPWSDRRLPRWVEKALSEKYPNFDLSSAYTTIDEKIAAGKIEDLGGFIEANDRWRPLQGASLHNRVHLALDAFECDIYCGDQTSRMSDLGTSPGNVLFWLLHDWIDQRYAECQKVVGEAVDRSPEEMEMHVHVTTDLRADLPV